MFRFEEAAESFLNAWQLSHTRSMLRSYVSVLPLFLPEDAYQEKLRELGADQMVIGKIQEYNLKVANNAAREGEKRHSLDESPEETLERYREEYRRSRGSTQGGRENQITRQEDGAK